MRITAALVILLCLAADASAETVARVFGKPVTRLDAPDGRALFGVVVRALLDDFAKKEKIEVTDAEVAAFLARMKTASGPDAEAGVRMLLRGYKIDQALYRKYGGRVAFQQFGLEPIDAYRNLLRIAEEKRLVTILDRSMEAELRAFATNDGTHKFIPEDAAKDMMSRAWWLGDPPDEKKPAATRSKWLQVTAKDATLSSDEGGFSIEAPPDGHWIEITSDVRPDRRWMVWVSSDHTRSYSVLVIRDDANQPVEAFAKGQFAPATIPEPGAIRYTHTTAKKGRPMLYTFGYVTGGPVKLVIQTEVTENVEPEAFKAFVRGLTR